MAVQRPGWNAIGPATTTKPEKKCFEVVVVDDIRSLGSVIERLTYTLGHQCRTAENVSQARQLLFQQPADIVVTDLQMPEVGGIEFAEQLRRFPGGRPLAVVGLTSEPSLYDTVDDDLFDHQLTKPISLRMLSDLFRSVARMAAA